ncbi:histone deacetylase family protein [Desulfurivibrio alkaliphilus]|uniref:Histone deacetylase n=1 Tax=Desulfurivibrio alkaliphilus (strain DSM 19089 / UNIQEM U267 / AHT2) TaxID=589865 RepID=D6Z2N2_DESAT|nr:histone deacetylase [Desulfurivibrio alkaliphilus]ADH85807.1 Histone deacetylase [Desulfurivibrio alkaliphilus AHT 2]
MSLPPPKLLLVNDDDFLQHDTGLDHPESPARLQAVYQRQALGFPDHRLPADAISTLPPRPAARRELTAIHTEEYLLRLEEAALAERGYLDHPDNRLSYDTYRVALLAAGAGLAAIDRLEAANATAAGALIRPPGHHAERSTPLGFCFLNNAAVAARYWQQRHDRKKIMIIDWDAHHGNGIQAAFEDDPEVFYLSIHEHPTWSFPGTGWSEERGQGAGRGTTLNLPLPPGSGDDLVLRLLDEVIDPALQSFAPEALIIAAGFDGHHHDDMSGLSYSSELYRRLGRHAAASAARHCPGRLLFLLEGGYQPDLLVRCLGNFLEGLLAVPPDHPGR